MDKRLGVLLLCNQSLTSTPTPPSSGRAAVAAGPIGRGTFMMSGRRTFCTLECVEGSLKSFPIALGIFASGCKFIVCSKSFLYKSVLLRFMFKSVLVGDWNASRLMRLYRGGSLTGEAPLVGVTRIVSDFIVSVFNVEVRLLFVILFCRASVLEQAC